MQSAAVGPVRPNMVVAGWSDEPERVAAYWQNLEVAASLGMGLVLVVDRGLPPERQRPRAGKPRRIDVWWRGRKNGSLMMLLAHLLGTNDDWEGAEVRLLRLIEDEEGRAPAEAALEALAHEARLAVTPRVIVSGESFPRVLRAHSCDATCVFLGFEPPPAEEREERHRSLAAAMKGLPTVILINSRGGEDVTA
jgi:hypothetical protein